MKMDEKILKPDEERKPVTFRMKPIVADTIRDMAETLHMNNGDFLEMLLDMYCKNYIRLSGEITLGCVNRGGNQPCQNLIKLSFDGDPLYITKDVVYKSADMFEKQLRKVYDLEGTDLKECVVGSSLQLARLSDETHFLLYENLDLKNSKEGTHLLTDSWISIMSKTDNPGKHISPFADMTDVFAIMAVFAKEMQLSDLTGENLKAFGMPDFS